MDNYILLKNLPDADAGEKIIWDETDKIYYFVKKGEYVSPHYRNYLTEKEVTENPEWFMKEAKRPPAGILPLKFHNEERYAKLISAIDRYKKAGLPIDKEWISEKLSLELKLFPEETFIQALCGALLYASGYNVRNNKK